MKSLIIIISSLLLIILSATASVASQMCALSTPQYQQKTEIVLSEAKSGSCLFVGGDQNFCFIMAKSEQDQKLVIIYDYSLSAYKMINLSSKKEIFGFSSNWFTLWDLGLTVLGSSDISMELYFTDQTLTCEEMNSFVNTDYAKKIWKVN